MTEYVRAAPSGHFNKLNQSVALLESKLQAKCPFFSMAQSGDAPRFWTPKPVMVQGKKEEKKEEEKAEEVWHGARVAVGKTVGVVMEWQGRSEVVTVQAQATVKALKEAVLKRVGAVKGVTLVHSGRVLSDDECIDFVFRDSPYVTVVPGEQPSSEPRESYHLQLPSLTDPSYTITPSIESLKGLLNSELACVKDVVIEKPGVGKIAWLEGVDLRDVNISEVVEITADEKGIPSIAVRTNTVDNP